MRSAHPTQIDAAAVSEDAFVFAYPLVIMERRRIQMTSVGAPEPETMRAPANRLVHSRNRVRAGIAPSPGAGTLSSSAWLDLAAAPVVLSVPPAHGRYYCLSLRDMWTNEFASIGPRTTGTGAGAYAIGFAHGAGAGRRAGIVPISAPTRHVRLVGETCLEPAESEAVALAIGRAYALTPLYGRLYGAVSAPAPETGDTMADLPASEQVDRMTARAFFELALRLLADNPPRAQDRLAMERAQRIGLLTPGANVWTSGDASLQGNVEEGFARGRERLRAREAAAMCQADAGWHVDYRGGEYGTDYLSRAGAARTQRGADRCTDALEALTRTDVAGRPLSGTHRYELRFAADAPPPVHGFWSLSTHAPPHEAGPGPAWSTPLSDRDGLTVDSDGSLRIRIQHDRPPRWWRSNWLPAPSDEFALMLRLHWPREELIADRWTPPAVARVS